MRQDDRAVGLRTVVGRTEETTGHGPKAHHVEVRTADDAGADDAWLAQADHREIDDGEVAQRRNRSHAGAKILKPGTDAFWGGYTCYFADPDGHPWEVAWNPDWTILEDGSVRLGG